MDVFTGRIVEDPITGKKAAELSTEGLGGNGIGNKYIELKDLDKRASDSYNNGNSAQASEYGRAKDILRESLGKTDGDEDLPIIRGRAGQSRMAGKKTRESWLS